MKLDLYHFQVKKPRDKKITVENLQDVTRLLELHGGSTFVEHKYDGYGILIDRRTDLALYSLAKKPWDPRSIPELHDELLALPRGFYIGELVGRETHAGFTNIDEYAAVTARPLAAYSEKVDALAEEMPLDIRVYDILELENVVLAEQPNTVVREVIQGAIKGEHIQPVHRTLVDSAEMLQILARQQFAQGKEGFVIKDGRSPYTAAGSFVVGKRNDDWIKIKRSTTFDFAVLGLYQTETRLRQGWACSNALLGTYNEETNNFETIVKLTIPSREIAEELYQQIKPYGYFSWSAEAPYQWQNEKEPLRCKSPQVAYSEELLSGKNNGKVPFAYVGLPSAFCPVVEVHAMQVTSSKNSWHTCGTLTGQTYSLRHAVFERFREDKTPLQVTTTQQIEKYFGGE